MAVAGSAELVEVKWAVAWAVVWASQATTPLQCFESNDGVDGTVVVSFSLFHYFYWNSFQFEIKLNSFQAEVGMVAWEDGDADELSESE